MRATRRLAVVALLALALAAAAAAAAGYEESFRDGMAALDQKKWGVAAASLRSAIASNPREGGKQIRVYGTWLLDYLPHYYLGVALYQLGDSDGAAEAWGESRRQGVILATALAADLKRWEEKLPPAPAAAPPPAELPPAAAPPLAPLEPAPPAPETVAVPPVAEDPAAAQAAARERLLPPARLYFEGRYREALAALRGLAWPAGPPGPACLLEAAAAFALYRQSGAEDARYLDEARRPLRSCAALAGGERPDPALFSPAFTRFYEETLARR